MEATTASSVDMVTSEIIRGHLESIAREMRLVFRRISRSTVLAETQDFAMGLFDVRGRMVAYSASTPVHIVPIRESVRSMLNKLTFDLEHEDAIITNDPYGGGTHLPDLTMMMPILIDEEMVLFPANRIHLTDIGGAAAGGLFPGSYEIYQEGDRIPPLFLYKGDKLRVDVLRKMVKNTRTRELLKADLEAMRAANKIAERRIVELVHKYGRQKIAQAIEYILSHSERRVMAEIERIPNGVYVGTAHCDSDLQEARDIKVQATCTVADGRLSIDFSGSAPQARGFVNSTLSNTAAAAVAAVLSILGDGLPINDGTLRPVEVFAPTGTVANAAFPAPTGWSAYHVGSEIREAIVRALANAAPEKVGVCWANVPHTVVFGTQPQSGQPYIDQSPACSGGCGAIAGLDGWGTPAALSGSLIPSVELRESGRPVLVETRELVRDSGGPGKWRGGLGTRVIERIVDGNPVVTAFTQGITHPVGGFQGGMAGSPNRIILRYGQGNEVAAAPLVVAERLSPGDRILIEMGGGGGWGDPLARDLARVRDDVLEDYVSVENASRQYGVAIDGSTMEIDEKATRAARQQ